MKTYNKSLQAMFGPLPVFASEKTAIASNAQGYALNGVRSCTAHQVAKGKT
ncbi:MAG: hypothetical protein ACJAUE_002607 [Alcanivorax sp.]|jgi:hypothetical protein